MYPANFDYQEANTIAEAVSLLGAHGGAKILAGGHSLIPAMKLRLSQPDTLIDIGSIAELRGIEKQHGRYRIGALTTHTMLASHKGVPRALSEAAGMIGDPQVRNRGTVGGNVAHADPASDLPTVFTALNATMHIAGADGQRTVAAARFFTGLFETALADNEVLVAVEVAAESERTGSAYAKLFNPASRYAMVGAAAAVTLDLRGHCVAASVAVGGLTPCATAAPSVAAVLQGHKLTGERIAEAARAIDHDLGDDVSGDIHASADYRRAMAPLFVERALLKATERAGFMAKLEK